MKPTTLRCRPNDNKQDEFWQPYCENLKFVKLCFILKFVLLCCEHIVSVTLILLKIGDNSSNIVLL